MRLYVTKNHEGLSELAAAYVLDVVKTKSTAVLGLATGGTPERTYQLLVEDHIKNKTSYKHIKTVNLDEYVGLSSNHNMSYRKYMHEKLFKHIDICDANIHIPNGAAEDINEECKRYDYNLDKLGYPDIQILGLGQNGHIGFNEPGSDFSQSTHLTKLTESTRIANARFFPSVEDVPVYAITMGIASILKSKKILLLVSGQRKANTLLRLFTEEVHTQFPCSALNLHDDVVVIADEAAMIELRRFKEYDSITVEQTDRV
ncbi:glucosamine-6-phosphate deaminase [Bacillus sp. HMF5848]|uniref:glucosamine-6-phosphate deaminase n=1 Tax=Bacillus sp. HMF5848 TaxID=2495421 RepID=UPI000F799D6C|nr:glucosamine-6-phosphate deaminase [Bacillus sp. HMF5848]RSK26751.1 glucosamine-6-phosphate deaminase [Bacillus sp. HMF5848]